MLKFWSSSSVATEAAKASDPDSSTKSPELVDPVPSSPAKDDPVRVNGDIEPDGGPLVDEPRTDLELSDDLSPLALDTTPDTKPARARRLSFKPFAFRKGPSNDVTQPEQPAAARSTAQLLLQLPQAAKSAVEIGPKVKKVVVKKSEKRVEASAVALRTLILGPVPSPSTESSSKPKSLAKNEVIKLKALLLEPKSANKVIAKLRRLPVPKLASPEKVGAVVAEPVTVPAPLQDAVVAESLADPVDSALQEADEDNDRPPIHAVCLDCTDEEADAIHFSRLSTTAFIGTPSIAYADLNTIVPVLQDMHIVSLLGTPDLGLGQPVSGEGILAGTVPSPEVVMTGLTQLTQQLFALGYATSNIISPNHQDVYPPLDRISVLTYWWGLEVLLPPASMKYLGNVKSIQSTLLNLLTALAIFNSGVREVLPFIRYISQFVDFEWNAIKAQDKGKGVVCAATWVMPAAMVPRPWDFPAPPKAATTALHVLNGTHFPFTPPGPVLPQVTITRATL